jgi:hypothetical protein
VPFAELQEFRHPSHGPIGIHNLADHTSRQQPGECCQVDRRFRLTGAHQHAAFSSTQRKDMARASQFRGSGVGSHRNLDRVTSIARRYARRHALPGVDRFTESGSKHGSVVWGHEGKLQLIAFLCAQRQANQSATVCGHEVDRLRRDQLCRESQIAFVFAILIIHYNQHPAGAKILQRLRNRSKGHKYPLSGDLTLWRLGAVFVAMASNQRASGTA